METMDIRDKDLDEWLIISSGRTQAVTTTAIALDFMRRMPGDWINVGPISFHESTSLVVAPAFADGRPLAVSEEMHATISEAFTLSGIQLATAFDDGGSEASD